MDNDGKVNDVVLPEKAVVKPVYEKGLLNGVTVLEIKGAARLENGPAGPRETPARLKAIPYHAWNNRGLSPMTVWLPREAQSVGLARGDAK